MIGHTLSVRIYDRGDIELEPQCYEPDDAPCVGRAHCPTCAPMCRVFEQCEDVPFEESHDGPDEPLRDGMAIKVWFDGDSWRWRGVKS